MNCCVPSYQIWLPGDRKTKRDFDTKLILGYAEAPFRPKSWLPVRKSWRLNERHYGTKVSELNKCYHSDNMVKAGSGVSHSLRYPSGALKKPMAEQEGDVVYYAEADIPATGSRWQCLKDFAVAV